MKNILIIEDDEFLMKLLSKKFVFEKFTVFWAPNGSEGISKMKELKPDLVLMDLLLPDMTGFDILTNVKKDPDISAIPVIILSNLDKKEEIERGLKAGAEDYLIKSQFTSDEIIKKVKTVLEME